MPIFRPAGQALTGAAGRHGAGKTTTGELAGFQGTPPTISGKS